MSRRKNRTNKTPADACPALAECPELTEVSAEEAASVAYELLIDVRVENMQGRMFWASRTTCAAERVALWAMVREGLVIDVPATPTSMHGYFAVPRAEPDPIIPAVNARGGLA